MRVSQLYEMYGLDQIAKGCWKTAIRLGTALFIVDESTNLQLAGAAIAAMSLFQAIAAVGAVSKPIASAQNCLLIILCILGGMAVPRRSEVYLIFIALAGFGYDTAWVKVEISEEGSLESKKTFDALTQHANAMEYLGALVGWPLSLAAYNAGGLPSLFKALLFPAIVSNVMPTRSHCRDQTRGRPRSFFSRDSSSSENKFWSFRRGADGDGSKDDDDDDDEEAKEDSEPTRSTSVELGALTTAVSSVLRGVSSIEESHLKSATETLQYRMTRRLLLMASTLGFFGGILESAATLYYIEVAKVPRATIVVAFMISEIMRIVTAYVMTYGHETLQISFAAQLAALYFLVPSPVIGVMICHVIIDTTYVVNRRATVRLQDVYAPRSVPYRRVVTLAEVAQKCTKIAGSFVGPVAFGLSGTAPFGVLFLTSLLGTLWASHSHTRLSSEALVTTVESFAPRVHHSSSSHLPDEDDAPDQTYRLDKGLSSATLMRNVIGIYGLIHEALPENMSWDHWAHKQARRPSGLSASMHGKLATREKIIASLKQDKHHIDRSFNRMTSTDSKESYRSWRTILPTLLGSSFTSSDELAASGSSSHTGATASTPPRAFQARHVSNPPGLEDV